MQYCDYGRTPVKIVRISDNFCHSHSLCAYGQKIAALVGAGGLSVVVGQVVVVKLVAGAIVRQLALRF